jgi:hypothetical protein
MPSNPIELAGRLESVAEKCRPAKDAFMQSTERRRASYLELIAESRDSQLDGMFVRLGHHPEGRLADVFRELKAYARQCDWNYIDPIILLACLERFDLSLLDRMARIGLVYQAFRMIDDVVDGHCNYKGAYPTLYGILKEQRAYSTNVLSFSLLTAILMLCEAFANPVESSLILRRYLSHAQHTALGMLREYSFPKPLTFEAYASVVDDKMVNYGLLLYGPVLDVMPAPHREIMQPTLKTSFLIAQITNDLAELKSDQTRGQLNYWHIEEFPKAADRFLEMLARFETEIDSLPEAYRNYGIIRLGDLANYAAQMLKEPRAG